MSSEVPTPSQEPTPTSDAKATNETESPAPKPAEDAAPPEASTGTQPKASGESSPPAGDSPKPQAESDKSPAEAPKAKEKKPKKPKKPGRWRRRFVGVALVLVAFAVVARIVIWVALPLVLHKTAAFYDLDLNYERLSFSTMDGEVSIWGLKVTPQGGGEMLAATDYIHGRISVMSLLRGRLDVWRAEADGVDLAITRNPDGTVPLIERFMSGSAAKKRAAVTPSGPIDLTPPAAIDAFRLQHVRAHVRDLSVSPPLDTMTALDLRVSDVGSTLRPTQFEVDISSDPVLDSMLIEGEGTASGATLDANVRIRVRGLHGKPAIGYLAPLGIQPVADSIDMKMTGHVVVTPAGELPATPAIGPATKPAGKPAVAEALAARIELENMQVVADEREAAGVDHIIIVADQVAPGVVDIGSVKIDGVRCGAYRDADGTLRAAGLEYSLAAGAKPAQASPLGKSSAMSTPATAAPATPQLVPAFKWSVGELSVRNVKATFADQAITPVSHLAFLVDQLTVRNIVGDPDRPDAELTVAGQFSSPGMARSIQIDGTAKPFAASKAFSLAIRATGVKPDAIKQYLDLLCVESELKNASFSCDVKGSATVNGDQAGGEMHLTNLVFEDQTQLLKLNGVEVNGIKLDPSGKLYHVDSIEVSGPRLSASRDASGDLSGLGFRFDLQRLLKNETPATTAAGALGAGAGGASLTSAAPSRIRQVLPAKARPSVPGDTALASTQTPADAVKMATTPPAVPASLLPRIELGRLVWKDVAVTLDDKAVSPASTIAFTDAGIELSDFRFDMNDTRPGQPGKFRAWASAPTIADRLEIAGTITPGIDSTAVDMKLVGRGLSGTILAPYIKAFGIEPTLKHGSLDLHAKVGLKYVDDVLTSTLALDNIRYAEGDRELAGVDGLRVDGLAVSKDQATIDSIEIDRPRIAVSRDPDGALVAGGVRLAFPLPESPKPPATKPALAPVVIVMAPKTGLTTRPAAAPATAPTTVPATAPTIQPTPFVTVLNKLRIHGATLIWADQAVQPPAGTAATVDVDLDHFTFGKPADRARLHVEAKAGDSLDKLTVDGTFLATEKWATVFLVVDAAGIRAGTLAPYLPPGVAVSLKDGRFQADIDAAVELLDQGGQSGHLRLDDLEYRDGYSKSAPPLLGLKSLVARVSRVDVQEDAPEKAVAIDEFSVAGLETSMEKAPDGSLRLLGLALGGPQTKPMTAPSTPASQPAAPPTTKPSATVSIPDTSTPVNAAEIVAKSHKVLPLITLEKLDLNVSRATITDTSRPGSAPLVVSNLHLGNLEPIALLGPRPATQPSTRLELTCKADPVVGNIKVGIQIAPFADQPNLEVHVSADGINGAGLTALAPELKEQMIDGSGLTDGQFMATFKADAKLDRRSPIDFDPMRPFELNFDLSDVEFRAAKNGPIIAGLKGVHTEGARIRPATGDVVVHLLEITKPTAVVIREKEGIHALGMLYEMPTSTVAPTPPATQPAKPSTQPTAAPEAKPTAVAATETTKKPASEMHIDKVTVSGLELQIEDRSVDPHFAAPITGLEVEILGLSNLALYQHDPIRFDATVNAGKVPLPGRNNLAERRPLFSEVTATGRVFLYPDIEGWAKASVSGFELASLSGEVKPYAKLSGGTFDEAVNVRFDNGSMVAHTKTVVTDLAYAEPPNGPITSTFKLGAPVDVMIGLIQDADGSITLPVNVPVEKKHMEMGSVVGSATGAVAPVLATAAASAPLKAVNTVTNFLPIPGLFGGDKKKGPEQPIMLEFPPGSTSLDPNEADRLTPVIKRLRDDKGLEIQLKEEIGNGDVNLARERDKASMNDARELIDRLHQRKLYLQGLRAQTAGQVRGLFASRADTEADTTLTQLHLIDRELAQTEDALDKLYDLLRPDASSKTDRRIRSASLDVAWGRLDAVKAYLLASGIPDIDKRIQKYNAQFNPGTIPKGGMVTLMLVPTKK